MTTYFHVYMITCLHAYMLSYMHISTLAWLMLTCLHPYMCTRLPASAYMLTCLHCYMITRLPNYMFTCSDAYILICLHVYHQRAQLIAENFRLQLTAIEYSSDPSTQCGLSRLKRIDKPRTLWTASRALWASCALSGRCIYIYTYIYIYIYIYI